jgi:hypothetical protein
MGLTHHEVSINTECAARIMHRDFPMKVIILFAGAVLLALLALAMSALRRNAGSPSFDDPKQVTPPPARDMRPNERRDEVERPILRP